MILNYSQYKKKLNEYETHSYGCVMAFFDNNQWIDILNQIDKNDLIDSGLEDEPHVSILYGIHDNINQDKLINFIKTLPNLRIKINKISLFENDKFDVVKFEINNNLINSINLQLRDKFEYTNDFPKYTPHMTICYVKKGCGKKYLKLIEEPIYITSEYYIYSKANNERIKIVI